MTKARDLAGFSTGSITNTTADGLILKGDGSSTDVVIKNGADATVATVSDGSTNLSVAGSVTGALARGAIQVGNSSGVAAALAKGTSGYVLTAGANDLSWAEGGGGLVFIVSSGAISNATNVSFTQFDSSKYDHYAFSFKNVIPATDNVRLFGYHSADGGSSYDTTDGEYHRAGNGDSTGFQINYSSIELGSASGEYGVSGLAFLYAPSAATFTIMNSVNIVSQASDGGIYGNSNTDNAVTARIAAEATTAIKFAMDSGNIESGEIVMYGIVNS